jgi:SAM-dependent MidA family methyltransferase
MAHSQRVSAFLYQLIAKAGGWIPFSEWMHQVLYAPGLGYYAAGNTKLADTEANATTQLSGDFVTAPQLTPLFGQTIAKQISEVLKQTNTAHVLEFGAGSGALAQDILEALDAQGLIVDYFILEVSADLKRRQQERLARWGNRVQWLDRTPEQFAGCVIANEVLDAMPVEMFRWTEEGALQIRGVRSLGSDNAASGNTASGNTTPHNQVQDFAFEDRPASDALMRAMQHRMPALPDYRSEINLQAEAWISNLGAWLTRGAALLIDYGFPRHEYYHPQRHRGTLMCHIQHRAHDDVFLAPGLQDITAHVDFTAIAQAGQAAGLDLLGYTSQARFLLNAGLADILAAYAPESEQLRAQTNGAVQKLISEAEMGELFKVIALGRGVTEPLSGFARGDRSASL